MATRSTDRSAGGELLRDDRIVELPTSWAAYSRYLKVEDKETGAMVPFVRMHGQVALDELVDSLIAINAPVRIITLKARRLGISTGVQGRMGRECWTVPWFRALTIADELDNSSRLFQMSERMWQGLPLSLKIPRAAAGNQTGKKLTWTNGSEHTIETARDVNAGRSTSARWVHASEVAFYEGAKKLFRSLQQIVQPVPGTAIFKESTPNGSGDYFHGEWLKAEAGATIYRPLFIPFTVDPQVQNWPCTEAEARHIEQTLDAREKVLLERGSMFLERHIPTTFNMLAWRRFKLANDLHGDEDDFDQEYPWNPIVAFQASSRSYLADVLGGLNPRKARLQGELEGSFGYGAKIDFVERDRGSLAIWKLPRRDGRLYLIALDPAGNVSDKEVAEFDSKKDAEDWNVIYVADASTGEVCARWHGRMDPDLVAEISAMLGVLYGGQGNEAIILVDTTGGHGNAVVQWLRNAGYPHIYSERKGKERHHDRVGSKYGLVITSANRMVILGTMRRFLRANQEIMPDHAFCAEAQVFERDARGRPAAKAGHHDDHVWAFALLLVLLDEHGGSRLNLYDQPRDAEDSLTFSQAVA